MLAIVLACVAMFVKDSISTLLVIAQSRGRAKWAGNLDALGDLASLGVTLTSAGLVIQHGWSIHAGLIIVAMMITSRFGTEFWTRMGNKIAYEGERGTNTYPQAEIPGLARRIAALEHSQQGLRTYIGAPDETVDA